MQLIDPNLANQAQTGDLKPVDLTRLSKFKEVVSKYEENFDKNLRVLKEALAYYSVTESVALSGLLSRLS
jgi:hypothetical protein